LAYIKKVGEKTINGVKYTEFIEAIARANLNEDQRRILNDIVNENVRQAHIKITRK